MDDHKTLLDHADPISIKIAKHFLTHGVVVNVSVEVRQFNERLSSMDPAKANATKLRLAEETLDRFAEDIRWQINDLEGALAISGGGRRE